MKRPLVRLPAARASCPALVFRDPASALWQPCLLGFVGVRGTGAGCWHFPLPELVPVTLPEASRRVPVTVPAVLLRGKPLCRFGGTLVPLIKVRIHAVLQGGSTERERWL